MPGLESRTAPAAVEGSTLFDQARRLRDSAADLRSALNELQAVLMHRPQAESGKQPPPVIETVDSTMSDVHVILRDCHALAGELAGFIGK